MGSSSSTTTGYKYYLGVHAVLCHGPVDAWKAITIDDEELFSSTSKDEGTFSVSKEDLFGGTDSEGGVSGTLDVSFGYPDQEQNSYLAGVLGSSVPAFRGVVSYVLNQMYLGTSSYLKNWSVELQRVNVRQNGIEQWYIEKAGIISLGSGVFDVDFSSESDGWSYLEVSLSDNEDYSGTGVDDSTWSVGKMPFGTVSNPWAFDLGFPSSYNTYWGGSSRLWLRKTFDSNDSSDIVFSTLYDSELSVWINGIRILNNAEDSVTELDTFTIPGEYLEDTGNVLVIRAGDFTSPGYVSINATSDSYSQLDMNPAHIIRECLTDPDWGMGYQDSDIDDDSFMLAADTLYDEDMGISYLWTNSGTIEDFVTDINNHIDAILYVDRKTGLFNLKLVRGDYDEDDLILLDESNVKKISNFQKPAFSDLTNSVTVSFWDNSDDSTSTITVSDLALTQMQGYLINTEIEYLGFTNSDVAGRVAARDLKALSSPYISCTIYANQDAKNLNIGDVFKFSWSLFGVSETIMRVTGLSFGDGLENVVKISATEDVFATPTTSPVTSTTSGWSSISGTAKNLTALASQEMPYYVAVQLYGQTLLDGLLSDDGDIGYLLPVGGALSSGSAINALLAVDDGSGYNTSNYIDFSDLATMSDDVGRSDVTIPINSFSDYEDASVNTLLQIDDELMVITSITQDEIGVGRGVLDSVPAVHYSGANVVIFSNSIVTNDVEYTSGESIDVKLLTSTTTSQLSESDATDVMVDFNARAFRPYAPGQLTVNEEYFPEAILAEDVVLNWAHRDRTQQTSSSIYSFLDDSIGPEAGTTYTLRLYDASDTLVRTETGLTETTYTWSDEIVDCGGVLVGGDGFDYSPYVTLFLEGEGEDGSTSIVDSSDNGMVLVVNGHTSISTSQFVNGTSSIYFDGAGDSLYYSTGIIPSYSDFTYEGFIRRDFAGTRDEIHSQGTSGVNGRFFLYVNPNDYLEIFIAGTDYILLNSTTKISAETWFNFAIVRDGDLVMLFVDGVLEASGTGDESFPIQQTSVYIGNSYTSSRDFAGYIDDLKLTEGYAKYTEDYTVGGGVVAQEGYCSQFRFELEASRSDGYDSISKHDVTTNRAGYGYHYGKYYGGL